MGYSDATLHNVMKVLDHLARDGEAYIPNAGRVRTQREVVAHLTNRTRLSRSQANHAITAALTLGVISRTDNPDPHADQRIKLIALTDAGVASLQTYLAAGDTPAIPEHI